jgi:hypothetical protein
MERCLHLYLCLFVLYDSLAFFIPRSILKCIERSSRMRSSRSSIHSVSHSSPKSQPKMEICFHSLRDCAVRQKFFTSQHTVLYNTTSSKRKRSKPGRNRKMTHHFCSVLLLIKKNIRLNHDRRRCRQKRSNQPAS